MRRASPASLQSAWRRPSGNMADVERARTAYHDADYTLSVSLYEECLANMDPSADIFLDYADALVQCGRLLDSLDVYSLCSRYTLVSTDRLKHVITTFMEMLVSSGVVCEPVVGLGCGLCEGVLVTPVTLACGHTFCAGCLLRDRSGVCRRCGVPVGGGLETNVLVQKVVEKWFPQEVKAAKLREEGNRLCQSNKFDEAIVKYTAALELGESTVHSTVYCFVYRSLLGNLCLHFASRLTFIRHHPMQALLYSCD